mmetsp:Transcript_53926/g.144306  ORF Transcript_53926/g.144306 Transcript_53926/m.144306 type:complete len:86 (+) Transcript_53926:1222-1479(+)
MSYLVEPDEQAQSRGASFAHYPLTCIFLVMHRVAFGVEEPWIATRCSAWCPGEEKQQQLRSKRQRHQRWRVCVPLPISALDSLRV